MTKTLLVTSLIFLQLTACVSSKSETTPSVSPNIAVSETPSPEQRRVIVKEGGWQVPGLNGSEAGKHTEPKNDSSSKMSVTRYVPGYVKGKPPVIEESFFSEEERQTLRLSSSELGDLVVSDLWGYEIEGRKFCYLLRVHPQGIGAMTTLYFYDLDGDENFETVTTQSSRLAPDLLPNWAK